MLQLRGKPRGIRPVSLIKSFYAQIYSRTQLDEFKISTPQLSPEDIEQLEQALETKLPHSFIEVIKQISFDTFVGFKNLFLFTEPKSLIRRNKTLFTYFANNPIKLGYLDIGSTDGYEIFVYLKTGEICILESGQMDFVKVADDLEKFILLAANFSHIYALKSDKSEVDNPIATYLIGLDGKKFWSSFANGWA